MIFNYEDQIRCPNCLTPAKSYLDSFAQKGKRGKISIIWVKAKCRESGSTKLLAVAKAIREMKNQNIWCSYTLVCYIFVC